MIAHGKGVGFGTFPREIAVSEIESTFYNVDNQHLSLLEQLPEKIFWVSEQIVQEAQKQYTVTISNNLVFSLADHINFAIERNKKKMNVQFPFYYDIEHLYPREYGIGEYAMQLIHKYLIPNLPDKELIGIALHFINNLSEPVNKIKGDLSEDLQILTELIEQRYKKYIDLNGFAYYRFSCHMRYLINRLVTKTQFSSGDKSLFEQMKEMNYDVYECMLEMKQNLEEKYQIQCNEEEQLYLMLHIYRLVENE